MSAIGTGYDLSASQFSPDGRVFQIEYALKAVDNSGTAVALKGKDGVVLAVEKIVTSKLYEPGTNKRIFKIDQHITAAVAGLLADARTIIDRARDEARDYRSQYGIPIPLEHLKNRVALYMHAYTLYSALRPFGCSVLFAAYDPLDGPKLFCLDPSGISWGYKGCAIGKAKQAAKTELEKIKFAEMNVRSLIKEASRIIYMVHDKEGKDKQFELEMAWIGEETKGLHQWVPKPIFDDAVSHAVNVLKQQSDSDEEESTS
ncbi:proteasome alpha7 subunit [Dermatophagoides pteronyssinus]|uniref:Proteasome subunit alpha type-3 n=2 Tax=Dermatophagoides pteronyssinus TaxID=6956 RepID=A0ABQ8JI15_DERPT|nr:proteasome subunit alpha type-3-like [Dermatophagoides pteronyssinus]KAH9422219.1 Proteasome subunit alpha type-3 [Dermatophagoides pteronyssinus]